MVFAYIRSSMSACPTGAVSIASTVTSIANVAYSACNGITSMTIPSTVTFIGNNNIIVLILVLLLFSLLWTNHKLLYEIDILYF